MVARQEQNAAPQPQPQENSRSATSRPPVSAVPRRIEGPRLALRAYESDDVEALYEAAGESIAEIYPWMAWCHPQYSRTDSQTWVASRPAAWESGDDFSYLVTERTSGRLLGGIGLNHFDWLHRRANLGYWVRMSATRQGVASQATRMLARMGFAELGLVRIEIVAAVDNFASRKVAEKAGAHFECIARRRLIVPSGPVDAAVYSLVAEDLRE